jgi:acyl carrier protein
MHAVPLHRTEPRSRPQPDLATHLRAIVADHLGVELGDVLPDVSFADDLAADSLDLAELAIAIEAALDISIPETTLQGVRTFRDLVRVTDAVLRVAAPARTSATVLRARFVPAGDGPVLERTFGLDPYGLELLREDARHAGRDARLELSVPVETALDVIAWIRRRLGPLAAPAVRIADDREVRAGGPVR